MWGPGIGPGFRRDSDILLHAATGCARLVASSARRELGLAERVLALGVGDRPWRWCVGQHRDAALHRRPRRDLVVPALHRRIFAEVDSRAREAATARRRCGSTGR